MNNITIKLIEEETMNKIEPATGLIQREGYDFIIIDTTYQIIAVQYYPFSETKISSLRNIR